MPRLVFIGRFQPFHKGHAAVIDTFQERGEVFVGVGSRNKQRTVENPLTSVERIRCVKNCFPHTPVFTVSDVSQDMEWVGHVEEQAPTDFTTVVTGNDWTGTCFRDAGYDVVEPSMYKPGMFSGTRIRRRIKHGKRWKHLVPTPVLTVLEHVYFTGLVRGLTR